MGKSRDYVGLASILLQLATVSPAIAKNNAVVSHGQDATRSGSKLVVGTIVNNNETSFLIEEESHHAYPLMNVRRPRSFAGRKVRVSGALQSPHVLNVETIDEIS